MGYLAASQKLDDSSFRKAVVFGSVMASFNVTDFGPNQLANLTQPQIELRYHEFRNLAIFEEFSGNYGA
jgi:hypothetical protein